jgi:hypothetical protein
LQCNVLRHTALTQLAQAGVDLVTLAKIAGHSSMPITQPYVHPEPMQSSGLLLRSVQHNINRLTTRENSQVGTNPGTAKENEKTDSLQFIGAKGGLEPPRLTAPDPKLRRSAGVSEAGACCRNPERSRGICWRKFGAKGGTRTPTPYGARS